MSRTFKYYFLKVKRIFTLSRNNPENMALGVALGVFVGLTPSVGLQVVAVLILATIFRGNKILAVIFTWISNPLSVIPLYGFEFYIGSLFWSNLDGAKFIRIKEVVVDFSFERLSKVGFESMVVLWTGSLVLAIPGGILSYFLFYKIIIFYRRQKELKMQNKKNKINLLSFLDAKKQLQKHSSPKSERSVHEKVPEHSKLSTHDDLSK